MIIRANRSIPGLYGDGSPGALTFDGTTPTAGLTPSSGVYTLAADILGTTITNNDASTIKLNGFQIRANVQLNNAGTIYTGNTAASAQNGGAAISATGTLQTAAGAGGNGATTAANGSNGSGSGGRNVGGGVGGNGGAADGTYTGGTGNNSSAPTAIQGSARSIAVLIRGRLIDATSINGAGGGGGGGANPGTGTATAGGGGSGSLAGVIWAKRLNNTGTIHANGANGAAASSTGNGKAGGGGGGGGGYIAIVTDQIIAQGTITASGGTGGAGSNGGSSGSNGTNGLVEIFTPA